jgi:hypothetical protein
MRTIRGFQLTKGGKLRKATIKILLDRMPVEHLPFCGRQGQEYANLQVQTRQRLVGYA